MYAFVINCLNAIIRGLGAILTILFGLLPNDPFEKYIIQNSALKPYLGFVNYFIPVADMLVIFSVWCFAIAAWYIYQVVLRWIKYIE